MRTRISKEDFEILKIRILKEYEETQVLDELARRIGIPKTRMAHYARKLGLKGAGNNASLTPELEKQIRDEYETNPNFVSMAKALQMSYNMLRIHAKQMGLKNVRNSLITWVDDEYVKCSKCPKVLLYTELELIRPNSDNPSRISYCRECRTKQGIANNHSSLESYLSNRIRSIRTRAKSKNTSFNITTQDLIEIYNTQNGKCFYTDIELYFPAAEIDVKPNLKNILSVDKIIPELGYTKENIVLCSTRANSIKGDLTLRELKEWLPSWYAKILTLNMF